MADDGRQIGIHVSGDEVDLVEEFDDVFEDVQGGQYSRSQAVKDAMRLAIATQQMIDDHGLTFRREAVKRHYVRDAIKAKDRLDHGELVPADDE